MIPEDASFNPGITGHGNMGWVCHMNAACERWLKAREEGYVPGQERLRTQLNAAMRGAKARKRKGAKA